MSFFSPFSCYQLSFSQKIILVVASGILNILVFPKFELVALTWVTIVPMLVALFQETRPRRSFLFGLIFGLIFFSGCYYWIFSVLNGYGNLHWASATLLFGLLVVYLSLYQGLFAYVFSKLSFKLPVGCFLMTPFLWVSTEYLRGHVLSGFPWCLTGYALVDYLNLAQFGAIAGVYGLSFCAILISSLIAGFILTPCRFTLSCLLISMTVLISLSLKSVPEPQIDNRRSTLARLVQPNISIDQPWNSGSKSSILSELVELSLPLRSHLRPKYDVIENLIPEVRSPKLIIWPETPAPFNFKDDSFFQDQMKKLAKASHASLIFGFVDLRTAASDSSPGPYNSVGILSPTGSFLSQYDKMHLVPFGEYVPLRWLFFFTEKVSNQIGEFQAGTKVVVSTLDSKRKVGTFICYEAVIPNLVRKFVAGGAEVLINVTNDAWFANSAAPHQHLLMARMRAIENGRYLLRAANSGISAVIDPFGRVIDRTNLYEKAVLDSPFYFLTSMTFYSRWGDVFAFLCLSVSLVLVVAIHRT